MKYRADIDGLRAVSVLSVILFHADFAFIKGGFVGVDIFFVISGYLITSLILESQGSKRAFLARFYERRIRRLIPPTLPVIAFAVFIGWTYLPPDALLEFGQSLLAYALFVSNWFFLSGAGYFDGPSHFKPLLNTWSLSVEEQFYFLFPVIVLVLAAWKMAWVRLLYTAIFVVSFALGLYFIQTAQADAAFYNTLARFWGIAFGGMIACGVFPAIQSENYREAIAVFGLLLIVVSLFVIDPIMAVPGLVVAVPVLGAGLVILGARTNTSRILAVWPLRNIGLISYALYLWHWPIFVLLRYEVPYPTALHFAAAIGLTFALSIISYVAIERPIRTGKILKRRWMIYLFFLITLSASIWIAMKIINAEGYPERFPSTEDYKAKRLQQLRLWEKEAMRKVCWIDHRESISQAAETCVTRLDDKKNALLVGDSHAAHLLPGLRHTFPAVNFSMLAVDSCNLMSKTNARRPACLELIDWINAQDLTTFDAVLISSRNIPTKVPEDLSRWMASLGKQVPVAVFGPVPFYQPNQPTVFATESGMLTKSQMALRFDRLMAPDVFEKNDRFKEHFGDIPNVTYVPLLPEFCPENRCRHLDADGWPILIDNSHMSVTTSRKIIGQVSEYLSPLRP